MFKRSLQMQRAYEEQKRIDQENGVCGLCRLALATLEKGSPILGAGEAEKFRSPAVFCENEYPYEGFAGTRARDDELPRQILVVEALGRFTSDKNDHISTHDSSKWALEHIMSDALKFASVHGYYFIINPPSEQSVNEHFHIHLLSAK